MSELHINKFYSRSGTARGMHDDSAPNEGIGMRKVQNIRPDLKSISGFPKDRERQHTPSHKSSLHKTKNLKSRKSKVSKYKPFSSKPESTGIETVHLNAKPRKHTYSWAPKSLSQERWKGYSDYRKSVPLRPSAHSYQEYLKDSSDDACRKLKVNHVQNLENIPPNEQEFSILSNRPPIDIQVNKKICDSHRQNDIGTAKHMDNTDPADTVTTPNVANKKCKLFPIFLQHGSKACESNFKQSPNRSQHRKSPTNQSLSQYIIDAGQKKFGATQCSVCGMVFTASHPLDEHDHQKYHKKFLGIIKFPGWKHERVITSFNDGRILKVTPSDPQYAVKKVTDMLGVVDVDLGFKTPNKGFATSKVAYLFISNEEKVVGCVIAERIEEAFRLLPVHDDEDVGTYGDKLYCTDSTPCRSFCGISRIWTYGPLRRSKIATRLVDAVRDSFVLGMSLSHSQIAFSDPTPDGRRFALKYFGTNSVMVYNFLR